MGADGQVTWVSGTITTFMSKVVMPTLWVGMLIGVPVWVYATAGRFSVRPDFQFIVWFVLLASVPLAWLTAHLQLVGYSAGDLVVANYWRETRVPFAQVAAVEPVWWYRGRLVRIRFHRRTPFGSTVYYMPKWGALRALYTAPDHAFVDLRLNDGTSVQFALNPEARDRLVSALARSVE